MIILSGFINSCDIALFRSWGTRINSQAISYLAFPGEALSNAFNKEYILHILVFIIISFILIRFYQRFFSFKLNLKSKIFFKILFIVCVPFALIIGIRGGFQTFPLDRSWVYFSRHSVLNQAALNSSWNFIHAVIDPVELKENPYRFFSDEQADQYVKKLHDVSNDSTPYFLNTKRPNIVLIMLESFSAEVMEPLNGMKNITPNMNALCQEGLLFTNFYTPGFRTEQGLAALVSGFPSQPRTTIIRQFGKFDKLPSLARTLDSAGYYSSYYYGGNLHFAFTGSYLQASGFDKIVGENDFEIKRKTAWGAYDEELFSYFIKDMQKTYEPFFSIIMTSTNHEPFDAQVKKINASVPGDWCSDYINTVHYTDQCIGDLLIDMKKQSWYKNTLIAIVADHAHSCPEKHEYNSAKRHHIPLLLLGGALNTEYMGKTFDKIASQVDFAATILHQLNINHEHFSWSRNVFNPYYSPFAFYSFDEGFGWVTDHSEIVYDHKLKQTHAFGNDKPIPASDQNILSGKAYLQVLMDAYIRLSTQNKNGK
jgi:phosphoglycerol transferase MdoB-like AlkP superfamily enzyme